MSDIILSALLELKAKYLNQVNLPQDENGSCEIVFLCGKLQAFYELKLIPYSQLTINNVLYLNSQGIDIDRTYDKCYKWLKDLGVV